MTRLTACIVLFASTLTAIAQNDTTFTYQGHLEGATGAIDADADFRFRLYDALLVGNQIGAEIASDGVLVDDGVFSVPLDFGANGLQGQRFLEIDVRSPAGAGDFTTLTPRQAITRAPFSVQTRGIFVNDDGLVGINTVNPIAQLHVGGSIRADGDVIAGDDLFVNDAILAEFVETSDLSVVDDFFVSDTSTLNHLSVNGNVSMNETSIDWGPDAPGNRPFHVQKYGPFGNGGTLSTGFSSSNWVAMIVGFETRNGDINENGSGDPLYCYPFVNGGVWHVAFDLRSHNDNESWSVWVLYIRRNWVSTSGV